MQMQMQMQMQQESLQKFKHLVSKGSFQEALFLYKQHLHPNLTPPLLPSLIKASPLPFALQLHSFLLKSNLISHPPTLNSLLNTYSNNSLLSAAHHLFDEMPLTLKDPVTWASMVHSYARNGCFYDSKQVFKRMCLVGVDPKPELVAVVVSVCGRTGDLRLGRAIHARAVVGAVLDECLVLATSVVDMYAKCGDVCSGLRLLDSMSERNVVTWTAMINGCVATGDNEMAVELVRRMVGEGVEANRTTMLAVLPACGELRALKLGKEIHGLVLKHGFELDFRVIAALIQFYSKCRGAMRLALLVFSRAKNRDTVTWSSIMAATSRAGDGVKTFKLFRSMKRAGPEPNSITMLALIDACIALGSFDHGQAMLAHIVKHGFLSDVAVGNSLVNMFAKCGCIDSALRVFFELMPVKDPVSYSTMIQSYGIHGRGHDALKLFQELRELEIEYDGVTILAVLSACNHSGLVDEGKRMFEEMNKRDLRVEHYACYVDLLGRKGRVYEACEVVRKMAMKPSSKMLSSLISACRVHGQFNIADELVQSCSNES